MAVDQEKKRRLDEVEKDLEGLRRQLQPPPDEPRDFADAGADLNQREELAGQIEVMENERDRLRTELGLD
ncbi:hypothetical protein [Actinocorallia longicatena]